MTTPFRAPRDLDAFVDWFRDQLSEVEDLELADQGFGRGRNGTEAFFLRVYSPAVERGEADAGRFREDMEDAVNRMNRAFPVKLPAPGRGEAVAAEFGSGTSWRRGDVEVVVELGRPRRAAAPARPRTRLASLLPSEARSADILQAHLDRAGFGGGRYYPDRDAALRALNGVFRAKDYTVGDDYREGIGWMAGPGGKTNFHVMDRNGVVLGLSLVWHDTPQGYDLLVRAVPATL